jgi:hypothetical protein
MQPKRLAFTQVPLGLTIGGGLIRRIFGFLLVLLGSSSYDLVLAQSPGTFTATGEMTTPRSGHTATLLTNGKVLIAGGWSRLGSLVLDTAELYDPDSGVFTPTGSMTTPRVLNSATLLPDGRVLIVGPRGNRERIVPGSTTAEIYDPSTGAFTATGDMISEHYCQQAILLGNGKVLIVGGSADSGFARTPAAELYDPATGTFTPTGTYANDNYLYGYNSCQGAASALLADGRVLIVWDSGGAEVYDADRGAFTHIGQTFFQQYNDLLPTATVLMNGKVLLAGGAHNDIQSAAYARAELYDPSAGTFSRTGDMTAPRAANSATLLPDGTVLMAGTYPVGRASLASAELYDPVTGAFTAAPGMITSRCCHTATLLEDGRVLIVGGSTPISLAELYNPNVLVPAPVLLSLSGDGRGQAAILHAGTARVVTASDPGVPGEVLEIYGTGLKDGSVIPPQVAIGGRLAEILYFGNAPGFTGLNQVNVRVPSGVTPGAKVPVRLTYLGRPSNAVTIGVQ